MPKARGVSLRPLLESWAAPERDYIAGEAAGHGLLIRTAEHKYICYPDDPQVQLFDMKNDPWETRNVAGEARYSGVLSAMRKRQAQWESRLEKYPGAPVSNNDREDEDGAGAEDRKRQRRERGERKSPA